MCWSMTFICETLWRMNPLHPWFLQLQAFLHLCLFFSLVTCSISWSLLSASKRSRALGIYQSLSQNSQNSGDFWCLEKVLAQSVSWSTTEQGEQAASSQPVLLLRLQDCLMAGSREMDLEGSCPKDILVKNNFSFPTQQQTMFYVLTGCWGLDLCLWAATFS